jgi:glycosyltransferase involved in cell wall biosynthesis
VVDNRPTDPATRELVHEAGRDDDRIRSRPESRPGSSVARNAGVAHSRAEPVAFTDDDVTVESEWLDWLVEPLVTDPRVTVVTGLVLPAELETPAQRWFEVYGGFGKGFDRREYDLDTHRADDKVLDPFWGGGFGRATAWPSARARSRRSAASTRRSTLEAPRGAAPTSRPSAV